MNGRNIATMSASPRLIIHIASPMEWVPVEHAVTIPTGSYGNRSYTANWTIHSSSLQVKPNGGTWNGSAAPQTIMQNYNTTRTIADPTPADAQYVFTGWTLSAGASPMRKNPR